MARRGAAGPRRARDGAALTGIALLVLSSSLLAVAAAAIVAALGLPASLDRVTGWMVVSASLAAWVLLVAGGLLHSLGRATVLGVCAVTAAISLLVGGRELLAATLGVPRRLPPLGRAARRHPWTAVLVAAAVAEATWLVFVSLVLPPYAYDGLTYHLPTVAVWLQADRFATNPLALCCAGHAWYPFNGELFFAWPAIFLRNDTVVDAMQLPFAALGALATGGIARVARVSASGATGVGALFFLIPIVVAQATTNYVDVFLAGTFLAAVYFVLRGVVDGAKPRTSLALGGLAAGLAIGAKQTAILYCAALAAAVVAGLVHAARRDGAPVRHLAAATAVFLAGMLATGGFWYGRNLIQHGNPVHPFSVEVAGVELIGGSLELDDILDIPSQLEGRPEWERVVRSWARDLAPWRGGGPPYSYEERVGGLGPVWPWLALPALAVFVVWAWRRRPALLVVLVLPIVAAWAIAPYRWWSRFAISLAALGLVALVHVVERTTPRVALFLRTATAVLGLAGAALATYEVDPVGFGRRVSALEVVRLAGRPGSARTVGTLFHREYRWLDDVPPTATVALELAFEPRFVSPVFGPKLRRHVLPLVGNTRAAVRRRLVAIGADYAFVAADGDLDRLLRGLPDAEEVYADDRVAAYRIGSVRRASASRNGRGPSRSSYLVSRNGSGSPASVRRAPVNAAE